MASQNLPQELNDLAKAHGVEILEHATRNAGGLTLEQIAALPHKTRVRIAATLSGFMEAVNMYDRNKGVKGYADTAKRQLENAKTALNSDLTSVDPDPNVQSLLASRGMPALQAALQPFGIGVRAISGHPQSAELCALLSEVISAEGSLAQQKLLKSQVGIKHYTDASNKAKSALAAKLKECSFTA